MPRAAGRDRSASYTFMLLPGVGLAPLNIEGTATRDGANRVGRGRRVPGSIRSVGRERSEKGGHHGVAVGTVFQPEIVNLDLGQPTPPLAGIQIPFWSRLPLPPVDLVDVATRVVAPVAIGMRGSVRVCFEVAADRSA